MKRLFKSFILVITLLLVLPLSVKATTSLQSIIDSASYDDVIKLESDYDESVTVPAGKKLTIDLNGHKITHDVASVDTIIVKGTLTIKGTGEVSSKGAAVINYPGGNTTIDNGSYKSTGWYTIKNMGTMVINNMNFTNDVKNGASLIVNGYYGDSATDRGQKGQDSVSLTINGGNFENKNNSCNVVKNDDYGNLVINGGTFIARSDDEKNANPVIQNWHKATINDGVFKSINGYALANGHYSDVSDVGLMTINGGTFIGEKGLFAENDGATDGKGKLTINGGEFIGKAVLNTKYDIVINDSYETYSIIGSDSKVVAKPSEIVTKPVANVVKESDILEDAKLMKDLLKTNQKILAFYDINLYETYGDFNLKQLSESTDKVKVTLSLPEDTPKVEEGYKRTYYVIRVHDGKTTVIPATTNSDGTITFETDKFSSYGLTYTDTKTEEVANPKTFDNTIMFSLIFIISVIGVVVGNKYVKKHSN